MRRNQSNKKPSAKELKAACHAMYSRIISIMSLCANTVANVELCGKISNENKFRDYRDALCSVQKFTNFRGFYWEKGGAATNS